MNARRPCGLLRRFGAIVYDALVVVALLMAATALAMLAGFRELHLLRDPLYGLYLLAVWYAYLAWCWRRGMTVGMRAWRIRLESDDGGVPGWGRCGIRFIVSLLSAAALGAGFWWSLFEPEKRCWHDLASRSFLLGP